MNVIATDNLCRHYGRRRGIDQVSLSVAAGETFGFLGPNGAGKSTTIRVLLGFLKASSGSATILGNDCWNASSTIKQDVGYVAGDVRLYPWLTASRAFQIVGSIRGRDIRTHGLKLAERFQLDPELPVRKMSRGSRQKVALVLALAHQPRLVILDEPTSGLDPLMQDTLADCLREMTSDGHTVFFSSHTLSEVESLCDRVAVVKDGLIVVDEKLMTLKSQAPRSVTLQFSTPEQATACQLPPFIQEQRREGDTIFARTSGPAMELTHWTMSQPLIDISISPPNLESLFRQYYI